MDRTTIAGLRGILSFLTFLILLLFATRANAILIQALPSTDEVLVGDTFTIDLVVSGLEQETPHQIVRAYHLDLAYTGGISIVNNVTFGDYLGLSHPLSSLFQNAVVTTDNVMLEEVSLWSDDYLDQMQPDSFVLATIDFMALNTGMMDFNLLPYLDFGIDIKGRASSVLPVEHLGGSVAIYDILVPEPNVLLLLGLGLTMIGITQHRRIKKNK